MAANQTQCSRLKQRSVIKFLVTEKGTHVKFTQEFMMCTEKYVLLKNTEKHILVQKKKIFANRVNIGLQLKNSQWSVNIQTHQ